MKNEQTHTYAYIIMVVFIMASKHHHHDTKMHHDTMQNMESNWHKTDNDLYAEKKLK